MTELEPNEYPLAEEKKKHYVRLRGCGYSVIRVIDRIIHWGIGIGIACMFAIAMIPVPRACHSGPILNGEVFKATHTAESLWENPLPFPPIVESVQSYGGVQIDLIDDWTIQTSGRDEQSGCAYIPNIGVTVNNEPVRWTTDLIMPQMGNIIRVATRQAPLPKGLNLATIRIDMEDGTVYTHEWAFLAERAP